MPRIRTVKPGVGMVGPSAVTRSNIAPDELRYDEGLVYRFLNDAGECIYIGYTASPLNRWQAHRAKPWFKEVATIYYMAGMPRWRARALEREAIYDERPRYNRTVKHAD